MAESTDKAVELLAIYDKEFQADANFRNLYQEVADVMFPRENQITATRAKGEVVGREIVDSTGITASIDATAGLSINLFPPGDKFYNIVMEDAELNKNTEIKKKLGEITEISHEKRANSNFMLQANETLRSLVTLGTGNIFSEWMPGVGLNYKDYDIGTYTFLENHRGLVDTMLIEFPYSAKQAFQRWGKKAGETVLKKMEDPKTTNEDFKFVWITRPRDLKKQRGDDNLSMPFETFFVSRTDKVVVEESGYPEFPFQVSRWTKSSNEKWGRGVGTFAVGVVNMLQNERYDLTDCAGLHNNPPKEVLSTFEGEVRVKKGDLNFVEEMGSIRAIQQQALGNFVITKDILEMDQNTVRKMFYNDAFNQLEQLKGDRRNELEIRSRLAEGLRKLVMPVGRIQAEWLTGMVKRDISLLLRNGAFGDPNDFPEEMKGAAFKVEYVGRLALELQAAQSMGWLRWVQEGAEIEAVIPGTLDNVDIDGGYRRRGITLGVSVDDMASEDEVIRKREARALKEQQALELQMAQVAGQANQGLSKAPEEGSVAEAIMKG
jgi:hypothetical protein